NEVEELLGIDIGLMPLEDTRMERGKCGFKLIQYMGLGIVSVASNVGMNTTIIEEGQNGFLFTPDDWQNGKLPGILANRAQFSVISIQARKKINDHYSFRANEANYLHFLIQLHTHD